MQDRSPPTCRNLLATHGRTIHSGHTGVGGARSEAPRSKRSMSRSPAGVRRLQKCAHVAKVQGRSAFCNTVSQKLKASTAFVGTPISASSNAFGTYTPVPP